MKSLVASVLAFANADETSLMQDLIKRSATSKLSTSTDLTSTEGRQHSTSKLLETAVKLVKNGATPAVIEFVDATNAEIDDDVLVSIQNEHDRDQQYIDDLVVRYNNALALLQERVTESESYVSAWDAASASHQECRAEEAYACARSRRCEEQLRHLWKRVKTTEESMREIHAEIHDEWCVHPESYASIEDCANRPVYPNDLPSSPHVLDRCFNWEDMSPYPILNNPPPLVAQRDKAVVDFTTYIDRKVVVEQAWVAYNEKIVECSGFEDALDAKMPLCDQAQRDMRAAACIGCEHSQQMRRQYGDTMGEITRQLSVARTTMDVMQMDRIAEWETLKIVQCLLDHVHSAVETSISTNAPCPTIDSDPEGVELAIEECHVVTRGCPYAWTQPFDRVDADGNTILDRGTLAGNIGAEANTEQFTDSEGNTGLWPISATSLTSHLCLRWAPLTTCTDDNSCLPKPLPCPCTPDYIAKEQASFLSHIGDQYTTVLTSESDYPTDPLSNHLTALSDAGWAGCAAPLVCVDCEGLSTTLVDHQSSVASQVCLVHQDHLAPGDSDSETFKCLDGTCLSMSGRCNGHAQCGDESDEAGCDAHHGTPEYLAQGQIACPQDFHSDVHFTCGNGLCIEKIGMCNGIDNCGDGSDEAACSAAISSQTVSLESTSGRQITLETLSVSSGVFHDRTYAFESLGYFAGKSFIKYSNDDKWTDDSHVMTKIRTTEPMTVHIVKSAQHVLPWLVTAEWTLSTHQGVTYHGSRALDEGAAAVAEEWEDIRHKEWDTQLNTDDHYDLSSVYSKTFPAGTIIIPGNDRTPEGTNDIGGEGVDGSFLIFIEKPSATNGESQYVGCFVDDGARDLDHGPTASGGTGYTFATCSAACQGYTFMSLQFGGECFCANTYGTASQYAQVEDSECSQIRQPCSGASHSCGGVWRQAVYQLSGGATTDGCSTDNSNTGNYDGDAGDMSGARIPLVVQGEASTAAVRCCSYDGQSCASSELSGGCNNVDKTFTEAHAICAASGRRLCMEDEVDRCCGTGCWFNHHAVWISDGVPTFQAD